MWRLRKPPYIFGCDVLPSWMGWEKLFSPFPVGERLGERFFTPLTKGKEPWMGWERLFSPFPVGEGLGVCLGITLPFPCGRGAGGEVINIYFQPSTSQEFPLNFVL